MILFKTFIKEDAYEFGLFLPELIGFFIAITLLVFISFTIKNNFLKINGIELMIKK